MVMQKTFFISDIFLGTRTTLDLPDDLKDTVKFQWSDSGSYRLNNMLEAIEHLPNRTNPFTHQNFAIYVLDNYAVHLMEDVKKALLKRGYILVLMGGGITGDIQINDTHLHAPLKARYREQEMDLMLKKLRNEKKVPSPDR